MSFLTRKRGSPRQIGQRFPIFRRKESLDFPMGASEFGLFQVRREVKVEEDLPESLRRDIDNQIMMETGLTHLQVAYLGHIRDIERGFEKPSLPHSEIIQELIDKNLLTITNKEFRLTDNGRNVMRQIDQIYSRAILPKEKRDELQNS